MRQNARRIVCGLLAVFSLSAYIWTNEKIAFCLLCIMILCPAGSIAFNFIAARRIRVVVETIGRQAAREPEHTRDGAGNEDPGSTDPGRSDPGNGSIRVVLRNPSPVPAFSVKLQILVRNLLTETSANLERSYFLLPGSTRVEEIPIDSLYVGRVEADVASAECSDALGLVRRKIRAAGAGQYEKYPELSPMAGEMEWEKSQSQNPIERYLHRRGNDPSEVLDIREYRRGDNVKRIHWKLSARLGTIMMRELDMPSDQDTLVVFALQEKEAAEAIHRLISFSMNLCWNLLREEIHHNVLLLDRDGQLIRNYDVASEEDYNALEQRVLEGGIGFRADRMDAYMEQNQLTGKYARIFYVSETEPEYYNPSEAVIYLKAAS